VNNNYYRFSLNVKDKDLVIPIELSFDNEGREMGVEEFEAEVVKRAINGIDDFETTKFAHAPWDSNQDKTELYYQFNFFNPSTTTDFINNPPASTEWLDDYQYATFTDSEIYFFANSFKGSFFKLDFYDSKVTESQKILFSVVLPTQQGLKESGFIGPIINQTQVQVKKPKFLLDYVGADKEGFFLYWLKNQSYLNNTTFYMSAKFFNAKKGQFVRMMNEPQSTLTGPTVYNFNKSDYFYYKVDIDYSTYEYKVYKETPTLTRVGVGPLATEAIIWYEYVNP
jgi:hypothetical protein